MSEENTYYGPQRGNFYTASRKVQELVGKLPDGTYIWGGPYTIPQIVSGLVVFAMGLGARQLGLWGGEGPVSLIFDLLLLAVLGAGTIFLVGKLPAPKRSILGTLNGMFNVLTAPETGAWRGRGLPKEKPLKSRRKQASPVVFEPQSKPVTAPSNAEERRVQEFAEEPPMCGLDLLLAASTTKG